MIPTIGLIIGFYVLAQLIPSRWTIFKGVAHLIAAVVAVLGIAELSFQGVSKGIAALTPDEEEVLLANEATESEPPLEADAPRPELATVTRADGGSITTQLRYGIAVAKDSSLRREWSAVHFTNLGVDLVDTPGIKTVYVPEKYRGEYRYRAKFKLRVDSPISAFEVRALTFDVWGNHVKTLNYEEVADIPPGEREIEGDWNLYSENDVEKHYASIMYVSRVRFADGRIVSTPNEPVLDEARRFSEKFAASQLDPGPATTGKPSE